MRFYMFAAAEEDAVIIECVQVRYEQTVRGGGTPQRRRLWTGML